MKRFLLSIWEILEVLIVAAASILIIYKFIAQPFLVQGASMEPAFSNGDYLIVDEVTYRFREPERGEVIVFVNPTNDKKEFYIKRIIGLPKDKVEIRNNVVTVNGEVLKEDYLSPEDLNFSNNLSITLKAGEYFVMGDNRPHSFDSRSWGPLNKDKIIGAVRLRFWPINELEFYY